MANAPARSRNRSGAPGAAPPDRRQRRAGDDVSRTSLTTLPWSSPAFAVLGGVVGFVSALQQILNAFTAKAMTALIMAVGVAVLGAILTGAGVLLWRNGVLRDRRVRMAVLLVLPSLVLGVGLGLLSGFLFQPPGGPNAGAALDSTGAHQAGGSGAHPAGGVGSPAPSGGPARGSAGGPTGGASRPSPASGRPARTYPEITGNRQGTPVFADPQGRSVGADVPARIPFGTTVQVSCKVYNTSALTSVSYWYVLETPPWRGRYAPSDTFTNGDPLGQSGPTNVDKAVPDCR